MEWKQVLAILQQVCIISLLQCVIHVESQVAGKSPVCPNNWELYTTPDLNVTCLWLSNEKTSWMDAMNWCKLMNGQLVEYKSRQFHVNLMGMITRKKNEKYWIGLSNIENEMVYKWMTSQRALSPTASYFKPGQQTSGIAKHCVNMDEKGEWLVEACKVELRFICQKTVQYVKYV